MVLFVALTSRVPASMTGGAETGAPTEPVHSAGQIAAPQPSAATAVIVPSVEPMYTTPPPIDARAPGGPPRVADQVGGQEEAPQPPAGNVTTWLSVVRAKIDVPSVETGWA